MLPPLAAFTSRPRLWWPRTGVTFRRAWVSRMLATWHRRKVTRLISAKICASFVVLLLVDQFARVLALVAADRFDGFQGSQAAEPEAA